MSDAAGTEAGRARPAPVKGPAAFRTISEASLEVGVPQHVLRFWETRFAFIRPTKRAGGRRFYRPQDLEVLRGVRVLLQDEGYTIKGVQKLHREQGLKRLLAASGVGEAAASRLAVEVEAAAAEPEIEPERAPEPAQAPAMAAGEPREESGDDEPQTGDLFDDPLPPPRAAEPQPAPAAAPAPPAPRSVLDAAARGRLSDVLSDLEATKAQIDALLRR